MSVNTGQLCSLGAIFKTNYLNNCFFGVTILFENLKSMDSLPRNMHVNTVTCISVHTILEKFHGIPSWTIHDCPGKYPHFNLCSLGIYKLLR